MIHRMLLAALAVVTFGSTVLAQAATQTRDSVDPRFQAPELPAPNGYRSASGEPGPDYWQQRADYRIEVSLDPDTHVVTGSETITYTNHSPDSLGFMWVQLDQNLFAPGSEGAQVFPQQGRFGAAGFVGGYTLDRVASGNAELEYRVDDTMMRVDMARPLAPGAATTLDIDWHFTVPEHGADRMGRDGDLHELAQWYPRMAVYDDVNGWNTMPYLGQGEFYLEYGDFDVAITVPATWVVTSTGVLQNPNDVLTGKQRERLSKARTGSEVVRVIEEADLAAPASYRPKTSGTLTWRYRAENVRDVAWATAPALLWDAAATEGGALAMAFYRPEAPQSWREGAAMTRHAIDFYSKMLAPYPYPTASAVEGPVYGMEYPMVVFVGPVSDREGLFDVIDHEWGHMWFPMVVGSDERRYAWMDEGFNTFINQFSKKDFFPESRPFLENVAQYATATTMFPEQPISTAPDLFRNEMLLGIEAYVKPAVFLNALRAVSGDEAFDRAFSDYVHAWSYRHPQPADFFRFMENRLGQDLGPFWRGWIYSAEKSDLAILGVEQKQAGDAWEVTITVDMRGDLVMPAVVQGRTETGVVDTVTIPMAAFYGKDQATATLHLPDRATQVTVNASPEFGDVNPRNNAWTR